MTSFRLQRLSRLCPRPLLAGVGRANPKELAPGPSLAELLHDKCLIQVLHLVAVPGADHHGNSGLAASGGATLWLRSDALLDALTTRTEPPLYDLVHALFGGGT